MADNGGELFNVTQFFVDDSYEIVLERVSPKDAVECVKRLSTSVGGRIGTTKRIIITDSGDMTCLEWVFEKGVVFPPKE